MKKAEQTDQKKGDRMEWDQLLFLIEELDRESQDTLDTLDKICILIALLCPQEASAYTQAFSALTQLIRVNQAIRERAKKNIEVLSSAAASPQASMTAPSQAYKPAVPPDAPPQASMTAPSQACYSFEPTFVSSPAYMDAPQQAYEPVAPPSTPPQKSDAGLIHKFMSRFARAPASFGKSGRIQHCKVCGNPIKQGIGSCPRCRSKAATETPDVEINKVEFSAVAPKTFAKGDYTIIKVIMYENAFRHMVDDMLKETDQETRSGVHKVSGGSEIKMILNSPDISIDDNTEVQTWQGEYLNFTFAVFLPEQYTKRSVLFDVTVYVNDVIATKLKFTVKCSTFLEQKISVTREDILSAFVSYASQDRNRVAAIIQGMRKARPDMDVFFDVDSLRSGEDWEKALHHEIEQRDILFLCWSHFARQSKWVDAEWRYALSHKGIECIEPIPIEPPGVCPPPDELKSKHFNDKLLYIINAESGK